MWKGTKVNGPSSLLFLVERRDWMEVVWRTGFGNAKSCVGVLNPVLFLQDSYGRYLKSPVFKDTQKKAICPEEHKFSYVPPRYSLSHQLTSNQTSLCVCFILKWSAAGAQRQEPASERQPHRPPAAGAGAEGKDGRQRSGRHHTGHEQTQPTAAAFSSSSD